MKSIWTANRHFASECTPDRCDKLEQILPERELTGERTHWRNAARAETKKTERAAPDDFRRAPDNGAEATVEHGKLHYAAGVGEFARMPRGLETAPLNRESVMGLRGRFPPR